MKIVRLSDLFLITLLAVFQFPVFAATQVERIGLATESRGTNELSKLMREMLDDYQDLLPEVDSMVWTDVEDGHRQRQWSKAKERFWAACNQAAAECAPIVKAQITVMSKSLRVNVETNETLKRASTLSAISDLCSGFASNDNFNHCQLNQRLHETAYAWMLLGREPLFVAYLDRYVAQRKQFLSWLESQGTGPPSSSIIAALPDVPAVMQASYYESSGNFHDARASWLGAYVGASGFNEEKPNVARQFIVAHHLTRLSWLLDDENLAREWQLIVDSLRGRLGQAGSLCWAQTEQWRIDIAKVRLLRSPLSNSRQTLRALIKGDCAFSQALTEYATDQLIHEETRSNSPLLPMLEDGISACDGCSPRRLKGLRALKQVVEAAYGTENDLADLAFKEQTRLSQFRMFLESDIQMSWAIAASFLRLPRLKAKGLALLIDVQKHLLIKGDIEMVSGLGPQQNRSRFDRLHRTVALAATEQGMPLSITQLEALRAQTLLRRLRLSSMGDRLKNVKDEPSDARYREAFKAYETAKNQLKTLPLVEGQGQALVAQIMRQLEDDLSEAKLLHLEALAARKLDGTDPEKVFRRSIRGFALADLDVNNPNFSPNSETASLKRDETYVSWLQVPGGYVASVLYANAEYSSNGAHDQFNQFIPVSENQASTLLLYRELLMSSSASSRNLRRVAPTSADDSGLSILGIPVWRTADGTYVANPIAPTGAKRVINLKEISYSLYSWLLQPLYTKWQPARRLILSPDGPLAFLPFETLWTGEKSLLDLVDISYVQSLAVHRELVRRATRAPASGMLSVSAPDYIGQLAAGTGPVGLSGWMTGLQWEPLPGTLAESQALKSLFPEMRTLQGRAAARSRLLELQDAKKLGGFRVLHFATHGYVDDQRSALVLSMHDGVQKAYLLDAEISTFELNSDLVLLSACDTGLGRYQSGEGVMGLPYGFMLAGNINTIMSLWPVDDIGTATFIPAFMKKVRNGIDLITALNETKREFATGLHGKPNSDPRIWAAFVQYGIPLKLTDRAGALQ